MPPDIRARPTSGMIAMRSIAGASVMLPASRPFTATFAVASAEALLTAVTSRAPGPTRRTLSTLTGPPVNTTSAALASGRLTPSIVSVAFSPASRKAGTMRATRGGPSLRIQCEPDVRKSGAGRCHSPRISPPAAMKAPFAANPLLRVRVRSAYPP